MNDKRIEAFLAYSFGIALVLLSGSLLLAVFNLGTQILSFGVLILFQIAVAVVLFFAAAAIAGMLFKWIVSQIESLHWKHAQLLGEFKKRTPWFVVLVLLISQAVLVIADKSFKGEELPTVAVTLVLIILFFLANELIVKKNVWLKTLGFTLWFLAIVALPLLVWAHRDFNTAEIVALIAAIPPPYSIFYPLCALVFLLLPLFFIRPRSE